jgi:hypothetical protein
MHDLPLREHDESETFLDLESELASLDSVLGEHLRSDTVSKNTSRAIQN